MNTAIIVTAIICGSLVALVGIVSAFLLVLYKMYQKQNRKEEE